MDSKCPGEDATNRAFPEEYACPACGADVEIWSDEKQAKCPSCGVMVKSAEVQASGSAVAPHRSTHDAS